MSNKNAILGLSAAILAVGTAIAAVMDGGVDKDVDRTRMEVLVRPFA